jgi:hypothetical protein
LKKKWRGILWKTFQIINSFENQTRVVYLVSSCVLIILG